MNIVIVDDDNLVCQALKTILESDPDIKVLELGHDGADSIALYEKYLPDVLLSDIRMKHVTGIDAGKQILEKHPDAKILYLTTFSDEDYIVEALKIGAKGYLLKQNFESIIPSIKAVYSGQRVFGDEIISKIPTLSMDHSAPEKSAFEEFNLSEKEIDIITQVAQGLSNKEIADKFFLSEGTVRNYISSVFDKLKVRDRTQLAIFYYKHFQ